ncbi:MAG: response regulator transcription factor [Pyrinomonadaceae bacterium]
MMTTEKRLIISVVDDDESIRKVVSRIVKSDGLDVLTYGSAEEYLNNGGQGQSACLILDVHLPGLSGVDLQERLNRSDSRIPIIFISADADEQTREMTIRAGAIVFLRKPFSAASLLAAVRTTLRLTHDP